MSKAQCMEWRQRNLVAAHLWITFAAARRFHSQLEVGRILLAMFQDKGEDFG
jgi:hypothetical protein